MKQNHEVRLFTTGRQHLFLLARFIAAAIDPEFLKDPKSPVVIGVDGTPSNGKTIMPDATVRYFFPRKNMLSHHIFKNAVGTILDQRWKGVKKPLEIDFMHLRAAEFSFGNNYADLGEKYKALSDLREFGGVSFLHNGMSRASDQIAFDMRIRIASMINDCGYMRELMADHERAKCRSQKIYEKMQEFMQIFNSLNPERSWARHVELSLVSTRMKNDQAMNDCMKALKFGNRTTIPIVGLNASFDDIRL